MTKQTTLTISLMRILGLLLLGVLLAGCQSPKTLEGPQPDSMLAVAANLKDRNIDVNSFSNISVPYPTTHFARRNSVAIKVTDYLLARVAEKVPNKNIRLLSFNAKCKPHSTIVVARVLCDASIRLQVDGRDVDATIESVNIGHMVALESRLLTSAADGAATAKSQVKTLIDQLVARLVTNTRG